jgi:hypothetical protein
MQRLTIGATVVATGLGLVLFNVKHQVQTQERRLMSVQKDIQSTKEAMHVLRAEWAYLNEPLRLQKLALKYTPLRSTEASQIVRFEKLPERTQTQLKSGTPQ